MLRASFLLFSLLLGVATGDSLFSREALFCGGGGGGEDNAPVNAPVGPPINAAERTCSIKVGNGLCLAANDYWYPMCYTDKPEPEAMSMEDCQNLAVEKDDATGWSYSSYVDNEDNATYVGCVLYVDGTNVEFKENYTCPDNGLTWNKDFFQFFTVGTGPIQITDVDMLDGPCYTCASTYTPPVPPVTSRSCSVYRNGICVDSEGAEYPSCYRYMGEELCKTRAAENSQVIGYTYYEGCELLFDANNKPSTCPPGYDADRSDPPNTGNGPISGTISSSGEVCYVCKDT